MIAYLIIFNYIAAIALTRYTLHYTLQVGPIQKVQRCKLKNNNSA